MTEQEETEMLYVASQNKMLLLGDYFIHTRTGARFVCKAIIQRSGGSSARETIIEIVPDTE